MHKFISGGGWPGSDIRKSYSSHGLNKGHKTYGGGSGYNVKGTEKPYRVFGHIVPKNILYTIIVYQGKRLNKVGFFSYKEALKLGYVRRVEYYSASGLVGKVENLKIR